MKKLLFLILLLIFFACESDLAIALPEVEQAYITEINNPSIVKLFLDVKKTDSLHISIPKHHAQNTQAFYIDKRLSLRHVIPHIKYFKKKLNNTTATKQYIAVLDIVTKAVAFMEVSAIAYMENHQFSKFYVKEFPESHMKVLTLSINFKANGEITIDGNHIEVSEIVVFLKDYIDFVSEDKPTLIYLNFDERLSFQQYIAYYNRIISLNSAKVRIATRQFVYDEHLLPDCNCVL